MKTNKIFRNIHINEFAGELHINAVVDHKNTKLSYDMYITSPKTDLNAREVDKLHMEANSMQVTLLPKKGVKAEPITFNFIGTWEQLINQIKGKLLELNRKEETKYLKLTFSVDTEKTKYYIFIKSNDNIKSSFTQVMTFNDPNFINVEAIVNSIKELNNKETIDLIGNYVYNSIVEEE